MASSGSGGGGGGAAARRCAFLLRLLVLVLAVGLPLLASSARAEVSCQRVRAAFQALQPGAKWVPESPGAGEQRRPEEKGGAGWVPSSEPPSDPAGEVQQRLARLSSGSRRRASGRRRTRLRTPPPLTHTHIQWTGSSS